MRTSHVSFAGAGFLATIGGVLLTIDSTGIVGWAVIAAAPFGFPLGLGLLRRERWEDDYDKRFTTHLTTVRRELEYAFRMWAKDQAEFPFSHWTEFCAQAEWAMSYEEVLTDEGALLLEFAKLIYPDDKTRNLPQASILRAEKFDAFHDPAHREMAHYLEEAGTRMSQKSSFRKWLWPRLRDHGDLVHAIIFLAMPLRMREHGSSDVRSAGFAYYPGAFTQ